MTEIVRQKNPELQAVVSDAVKHRNAQSFDTLKQGGGVHINADKDKLFESIVGDYMQAPDKTLIITPFNRDRQ